MTLKPAHTFSFLSLAFIAFSFSIYLKPAFSAPVSGIEIDKASAGRLVWQKYNCQSCHQLFGLGGYLGPDLTNEYTAPGKGAPLIRAFLKAGVAPMPAFNLSEAETVELLAYLQAIDASGSSDPRRFTVLSSGMTTRQ